MQPSADTYADRRDGGAPVVLVIEHDAATAEALADHLVAHGWRVEIATEARPAVERAVEIRPDLVLVDPVWPDRTDLSLLQDLRAEERLAWCPILARVHVADEGVLGDVLDAGADDAVSDDASSGELTARVRAALRARQRTLDLVRSNRSLDEVASLDALTALPNRRRLGEAFGLLSALAVRSGEHVGVLMLDVDKFKQVNDTLGHAAGDQVLCETADRLRRSTRASDAVARPEVGRWAGDEFVMLGLHADPAGAQAVAERIHEATRPPVQLDDGREATATVTIGVAIGHPPLSLDDLLAAADESLYAAKQVQRGTTGPTRVVGTTIG